MATHAASVQPSLSLTNPEIPNHVSHDPEKSQVEDELDYTQRGQWLRAALLGANDGLVSVASLMMGVGSVKQDIKPMLLAGFAGLVAGACSMAIGEFVSVYTQLDIERAQLKRERMSGGSSIGQDEEDKKAEQLPIPMQAAIASALAFAVGAVIPLLAAVFIHDYKVRLIVVTCVVSLALVGFGVLGAVLGNTPVVKSSVRVLFGGWVAMAITFGLTRVIGGTGLDM
ncbi:hypothetical protein Tsubulata_033036 [Turnera subulata]|uniref:Vacuolar iron transporter n=1 Tax=Turnera subulata TaxID=218843 RepID=A0A9Q0JAX6_9ROSI|nr:hypothetical protein Tsubulata_033036 [Turnera subulata]